MVFSLKSISTWKTTNSSFTNSTSNFQLPKSQSFQMLPAFFSNTSISPCFRRQNINQYCKNKASCLNITMQSWKTFFEKINSFCVASNSLKMNLMKTLTKKQYNFIVFICSSKFFLSSNRSLIAAFAFESSSAVTFDSFSSLNEKNNVIFKKCALGLNIQQLS